MELLCLDQDALARALSMPEAMASARLAFRGLADGAAAAPPRCVLSAPAPPGTTLVMGGAVKGEGLAAKVVTVNPSNPAEGLPGTMGLVIVLDPVTGQPRALCDGTWLTAWRTGAASRAPHPLGEPRVYLVDRIHACFNHAVPLFTRSARLDFGPVGVGPPLERSELLRPEEVCFGVSGARGAVP